MVIHLYTDGGARGNPGPAGVGGILKNPKTGAVIGTFALFLGERTNNEAEYEAILEGLKRARAAGATDVHAFLDSELVVEQLERRYRVKDPDLAKLFVRVWNVMQGFSRVSFQHIPREKNTAADALVNQAIDRGLAHRKN